MTNDFKERDKWEEVNQLLVEERWKVNPLWLEEFYQDPLSFPNLLSRYKFAAKMVAKGKDVLELGCQYGMGVPILSEFCRTYLGVENDEKLLNSLENNLNKNKYKFLTYAAFESKLDELEFDSIVVMNCSDSFIRDSFFKSVESSLKVNGQVLCGFHTNLLNGSDCMTAFYAKLKSYFKLVVPFFLNNEVVQCGVSKSSDYIFYLGCSKQITNRV